MTGCKALALNITPLLSEWYALWVQFARLRLQFKAQLELSDVILSQKLTAAHTSDCPWGTLKGLFTPWGLGQQWREHKRTAQYKHRQTVRCHSNNECLRLRKNNVPRKEIASRDFPVGECHQTLNLLWLLFLTTAEIWYILPCFLSQAVLVCLDICMHWEEVKQRCLVNERLHVFDNQQQCHPLLPLRKLPEKGWKRKTTR